MNIFNYLRSLPDLLGPQSAALLVLAASLFIVAALVSLASLLLPSGKSAPPCAAGTKHRRVS